MTEVMDDVAGQSPNQSRLTGLVHSRLAHRRLAVRGNQSFSVPLALGPGRRSEFFDPKVRVMPRPY